MAPVGMDDFQQEALENENLGESFASAEARFAYERARRLRAVLKIAGGLLLLVAFGFVMYRLGGGFQEAATGHDGHGHAHGGGNAGLGVSPVGSPQAKVKVTAIVPSGSDCHSGIIKFLLDTAKARPDQIRADFYTMDEYGQTKLADEIGQICAAVMVNGETQFDVIYDGKNHTISLIGTEPTHYTLGDVGEAITQVFTEHYGDPGEPLYVVKEGNEAGKAVDGAEGIPAGMDGTGPGGEGGLQLPGFKGLDTDE